MPSARQSNESFDSIDSGSPAALAGIVAANVRRFRERRRLSLSELAARARVGKSTLSQIESGRANPSMETLWAIATALSVPFGQLVSPPASEVRVVRAGEGVRVDSEGADFVATLLAATGRRGPSEIYVLEADPGRPRLAEPHPEGVLEHVVVMTGELEVGPGDEPVRLRRGELASFPGDVAHRYRALRRGTRAVLVLDYP